MLKEDGRDSNLEHNSTAESVDAHSHKRRKTFQNGMKQKGLAL